MIEVAKLVNVDFSASVWDLESLNWVKDHLSFVKVGSGDITAYPMLREIAKLSLPVILSTGLSTIGEIRSTIDFIKSVNRFYNNSKNISILQCTSCYPCPIDEVNLQVMTTLKKEFECQIGYSHHTVGTLAVDLALALGASIIEVHYTDNRDQSSFRDHQLSFQYEELCELKKRMTEIPKILGSSEKNQPNLKC